MSINNYIGIHHCEILVTDLKIALSFYVDKLGLKELHNPSSFSESIWLEIGNQQLHLSYHPISDANEDRHFAIAVDNLVSVRSNLERNKVVIKDAVPIPGVDRFFVFDPFGNRIEFVQVSSDRLYI